MAKCKQCGEKIDNDSSFCKYCGMSTGKENPAGNITVNFCAGCGAWIPSGGRFCLVCGTKAGLVPTRTSEIPPIPDGRMATGPFSAIAPVKGPSASASVRSDKSTMTGAATLMLLVLFAGLAIVAAWRFLPFILPVNVPPAGEGIAYVKDDGTLMLSYPGREPYLISEGFKPPTMPADIIGTGDVAATGPDGRYMAYLNASGFEDGGGLYLLDLSRLDRPDMQKREGNLVSENAVKDYSFSTKGNYLTFLSTKGGLYAYDYKNLWLLDSGVTRIIEVGEKQILYSKTGVSAGRYDYYLRSLERDADDKVLIAQNASELLDWTANMTSFIYLQPLYASGKYPADVMHYNTHLYQSQILVSGADAVIDVSAEQASVVYAKKNMLTFFYEDMMNDSMSHYDLLLKKPAPEAFGLPEGYMSESHVMEDNESEQESEDIYYDAYLSYMQALEAYTGKQIRDAMRDRARQAFAEVAYTGLDTYEIMLYKDNAVRVIDQAVFPVRGNGWRETLEDITYCDLDKGYLVYVRSDPDEIPKIELTMFAENEQNIDIEAYYLSNLPRQLCISPFTSEPKVIYSGTGESRIIDVEVAPGLEGVYYTVLPPEGGDAFHAELYYSDMPEGEPLEPLMIDKGVYRLFPSDERFNESVLYIKNYDRDTGDVYGIKKHQNPFTIAEGISIAPGIETVNAGKSMLYYRRFGESGKGNPKGEFYILERQERFIVGGVYAHDYRSDKLIYIMRDSNEAGAGELCVYREGGITPVDTGVTAIISLHKS